MTTISAVGLGVNTQINKNINSKQKDERLKATYGLTAVALITTGITVALGLKYRPTEAGGSNPLWNNLSKIKTDEITTESVANWGAIFVLAGSGVSGLGLAIDKGVNGKKRDPAEQKKRDIAMGVMWAVFGIILLSGAAIKKKDTIKAAFDNKYAAARNALKMQDATLQNVKAKLPANAPLALKNAVNLKVIQTELNKLTLKARAGAALKTAGTAIGGGLTKTATLFKKPDQSLSWPRISSALLLLASIIILAVLKNQNKLKPAPKPGKPAPPPKVAPGEIVMYVMISLSVLIFGASLVKDKFFPGTPAAPVNAAAAPAGNAAAAPPPVNAAAAAAAPPVNAAAPPAAAPPPVNAAAAPNRI
jgi:hypothetical protein